MNKQSISFKADEQKLTKTGGIEHYASNIVAYIEATFDLGANWSGYDSVRAVWSNDYLTDISTVLDSNGKCIVPTEVLTDTGNVTVNLVGSIADGDTLTDRLTTYPCKAVIVDADAKVEGDETESITPSQFEQFVEIVRDEAEQAEADADRAEGAADSIKNLTAEAETLPAGSSASASYDSETGVMTFGIPQGEQGERGADGVTPDIDIGTVETLETGVPAYANITGTVENPSLNLGLPKGNTGDTGATGAPAGFGAVTATIDGTTGTPSVDVTASGADTAKNFAFAFHNLKGQKGDKGDTGEVSQAEFDEAVSDLKSVLNYYAVSKNMLGLEANVFYPCYIPNGSKITISTKDGLTVNDNAVILDLWKQDKTRSDYWGISGYSVRTITVVHDIYYVSIRKAWTSPLQVEKGNTATAFEDWFLSARYLTQELDDINENTKVLSVADRANLLNELETHYVTGYLDISNGQINSNNNYYTEITNYILVNVGEKYLYSGLCGTSIAGACFYDENFSYISGVGGDAVTPVIKEITIPNNTKYVRFASFHNGDTIVSKLLVSRKQDNIIHINNLTHKEWYACGDSYTEGAYVFDGYNPSDKWLTSGKYANLLKCYPYYIGNRTNCNVHNIALSGSTLAKVTNDDYSFSYQKYTTIPNTADYITLWFGINDEAQNVPIGNNTDSVNTTFKGAWNIVLAYLLEHCPKAHIGIIVSNSLSQSYVDATIAMAERWGVPYLDLNSDNVPLMQNTLRNVSDDAKAIAISKFAISSTNMHPNYWAHEFESYFIEDFLKRI